MLDFALRPYRSLLGQLAVAALVGGLWWVGGLTWLDHAISDARFGLWHRAPTGRITVVDIDEASLTPERGWPWSRTLHAALIDALLSRDADSIAFDVDFSSASNPDADSAFEAALKRADDSVILAALKQPATRSADNRDVVATLPLARFADHSWLASVNQWPDRDGLVRAMARSEPVGAVRLPTLAMLLAAPPPGHDAPFSIDYGIEEGRIRHVSANALLTGSVSRDEIAGRKILIGATALELRDEVAVPRFGLIPGVVLHAMAAESLMQGRALRPVAPWLTLVVSALALAIAAALGSRVKIAGHLAVLAAAAVIGEGLAVAVQNGVPLLPATAPIHTGLLCFALLAVAIEIDERRIGIVRSRSQADRLRAILNRVIADNYAGIVVVDHDGSVRAISAAAASIIGLDPAQVEQRRFDDVLPGPLAEACADALVRAGESTWWRRPAREITARQETAGA